MENNVGLRNINSICYLNVLIQSVLSCDVFVNAIKTNKDKYMNETNVIGLLFYNIIYKMEHEIDIGTDNFTISEKLEFVGQNCSHEALIFIIDKLHLDKLFDIKYEKTIFCISCDETLVASGFSRDKEGADPNFWPNWLNQKPRFLFLE